MERFMGHVSMLIAGQAIEAVRGLYHFLCVPEVSAAISAAVVVGPSMMACVIADRGLPLHRAAYR